MSTTTTSHVFGPVPSRRLGRSLGVDVVPFKTCTYDCVYCQLGRTTNRTVQRHCHVPPGEVLEELGTVLASGVEADYITIAGSGEPTLYEPLDELIRGIKALTAVPVVVLTNGSLLWQPAVRRDVALADVVVPSLDAGDEKRFQLVNRPHPDIGFADMTAGLIEFGREYRGRVWLEVFLLGGMTAGAEQVRSLGRLVERINPDRVDLNTVARPPAERWAQPASTAELAAAAAILGERCAVVADHAPEAAGGVARAGEEAVLGLLQRRPCRLDDLAAGLGMHRNEVVKHLQHLLRMGAIEAEAVGAQDYYRVALPHWTGETGE